MSEIDPYITTPQAGSRDASQTPAGTGFVLFMPERSTRVGYEFESAIVNTGTVTIRYGLTGTQYEIIAGGAHMRGPHTGGVYTGDIYAKTSVGGEKIIAREW